jgi:hypothetical protein
MSQVGCLISQIGVFIQSCHHWVFILFFLEQEINAELGPFITAKLNL